ncbi:lytic transglycosylase domain-containing protein [Algiphilus sp. W345]|uniref:Lytic transglycosylase domain-containing protein n=1 Tax=Banduia mediterranea TaxID=3075609 RepID=A0ABU2WG41_9GAMM|nr:lytic transglycosylase domain-containing protein [Algiphilus sp. W345]MDT0496510.1 lytic transglycosylase domain-containing protein [Algiphilus sp. W345]
MTPGLPIAAIAARHHLPPQLVQAIVQVESGGDANAMRCEPAYPWLWNVRSGAPLPVSSATASRRLPPASFPSPRGSSRLTEWLGQQTSWGVMQVMGAVARELGYEGHFAGLCDPATGLDYGCRYLARLAGRFRLQHGWPGVVAAYNAGSPRLDAQGRFENQVYVDKVAREGGFQGLA